MTREEAIKVLNGILHLNYRNFWDEECDEAIDMAIEALSADAVMRDATAEEKASVQKYIDSISTEAVQVVRCKDCRHRCKEPIYSKADVHWVIYQIGDCPIICKTVSDDDYCSWGERREE